MKSTVTAPANIAFVKYWGARDLDRAVPAAPSISMTLRTCTSRCTVEFLADETGPDEIHIDVAADPSQGAPGFTTRILRHLDRLRESVGRRGRFRMATRNNFPSASGLASSASGFAALTISATRAMGVELDASRLSSLARLSGSGSAARSVLEGFVEWPSSADPDHGAELLAPSRHWDLRDVIAVVETGAKEVSSREGHRRSGSSPFFATRLELLGCRLEAVRSAIRSRDLQALGPILEEEAIELHLIAMSSRPPIFYWKPATLRVLEEVRALRGAGLPAYATMDAGANVHVICSPEAEPEVARRLAGVSGVISVIRDGVGAGPTGEQEHLF